MSQPSPPTSWSPTQNTNQLGGLPSQHNIGFKPYKLMSPFNGTPQRPENHYRIVLVDRHDFSTSSDVFSHWREPANATGMRSISPVKFTNYVVEVETGTP